MKLCQITYDPIFSDIEPFQINIIAGDKSHACQEFVNMEMRLRIKSAWMKIHREK